LGSGQRQVGRVRVWESGDGEVDIEDENRHAG
jgi:hypothetical protein